MGKQELIERLKKSMDSEGLFTISGNASTIEVPDTSSLTREEKVNMAIKMFENSLENKPKEAIKVYLAY